MKPLTVLSQACERNKGSILEQLRLHFGGCSRVLEIGSGTGQHAAHFAAALPQLQWQPTELADGMALLQTAVDEAAVPNIRQPWVLDVRTDTWPNGPFDALFSANTLHIMGWEGVVSLFARLPEVLAPGAVVAIYGPFNYGGSYTSDSNAAFDGWLKARDPASGIRDSEAVQRLAGAAGLLPLVDHAMPANNRLLVWRLQAR